MWKLVRDKVPQIIRENGQKPKVIKVSGTNLIHALQDKLVEEAREVARLDDTDPHSAYVEELCDLIEVIESLQKMLKISKVDVAKARLKKVDERGGFYDGIMLLLEE